MPDSEPTPRSPAKSVWIIAYLLSPALPFICLRYARAIGTLECVFGVLAALIAHIGIITVLAGTNGNPLQIFIVLLLGVSLFLIVFWQFHSGHRAGLWSSGALKQWRLAGRIFGGFLTIGIAFSILGFHLRKHLDPEHAWIEPTKPNKRIQATGLQPVPDP